MNSIDTPYLDSRDTGTSAMDTAEIIEPGDFIGSRIIGQVCGFVIAPSMPIEARKATKKDKARPALTGYRIRLANGREDFIDDGSVKLIHKSDDWWSRLEAEAQERG